MRSLFYPKLAVSNIRKNSKLYFPFMLTGIITIAMYYIIVSIMYNRGLSEIPHTSDVRSIIGVGVGVVAFFSVIFMFYTNSFVIKRRKKELGLYNVLGMDKGNLMKMIFAETILIAVIELAVGFAVGITLSRLIFLILLKIVRLDSPLEFMMEPSAMAQTGLLFGVVFLAMAFHNIWQVYRVNTIDLLQGSTHGEREPKTKILLTLTGAVTLGAGYFLALTTKTPLQALGMFFVAVILVIIGTYCLFTAGSIAMLKLLKKNRNYYYRTNHFISVSGMIYRMKQNAVGLANICILSTMVLIMLSATISLYVGVEDILVTRFPHDFEASLRDVTEEQMDGLMSEIAENAEDRGDEITDIEGYRSLSLTVLPGENNHLGVKVEDMIDYSGLMVVEVLPLADYNTLAGKNETLSEGEVLIYKPDYNESIEVGEGSLYLGDLEFKVKKIVDFNITSGNSQMSAVDFLYMVVPDLDTVFFEKIKEITGEEEVCVDGVIGVDYKGTRDEVKQAGDATAAKVAEMKDEVNGYCEVREDSRKDFYGFYGGFLFLGIYFGSLFLMATVLIIYYKQISEGYDDKERFQIMQKVGMSRREVKRAIHSQIVIVFALPLAAAVVHVCVAFPIMVRLLAIMNLTNAELFRSCTIATVGVFAAIYAAVYLMTAKEYYRIVK